MDTALKSAVWYFQQHKIPIEAGPISEVALTMFKDYRKLSTESLIEKITGSIMELFLLYVDRCYKKET